MMNEIATNFDKKSDTYNTLNHFQHWLSCESKKSFLEQSRNSTYKQWKRLIIVCILSEIDRPYLSLTDQLKIVLCRRELPE